MSDFIPTQFVYFGKAAALYTVDFVHSQAMASVVTVFKGIALMSLILMGVGMVVLIVRLGLFGDKVLSVKGFVNPRTGAKRDKYTKGMERIRERLRRGNESEDRLAVLEADKLLDGALQDLGQLGDSFGERLKALKVWRLSNIDEVWEAHKLRNRIVHEPGTRVSHYDAEGTVKIFEEALRQLKCID
ncbi:MAG: hypothetical protein HYS57_00245 [Parcubacteria group bacterium]|nr:hypothetical protein [Parcubacteria group bacterium]